ncbi:efflux RND transporter periplasmic adaptor subunit [Salisaeta longa]|uniref:efflux RND transporter periplasmic adaptor subunit n=1 Tax=Salisaeta longa TaxID=503170 RepID=UPI0003B3F555|nr:efflux RND transporter periplasmic adaptor subunit [Salisaeta longa]
MKSYLIGAGLIAGSIGLAVLLGVLAPQPPTQPPPPQAPLVRTAPVTVRTGSLTVQGTGTVEPAREIQLNAQVRGRLVRVSDALVTGGRFSAGEVLAQIDPTDYRSAVAQAQAQVTQARFNVIQARQQVEVARLEYQNIKQRTGQAPNVDTTALGSLIFKEPQLRQAQAALKSAQARLQTARANLNRTSLQVPFDGIVRTKQADLGAFVAPGTPIATVFSTEAAEVTVSLSARTAALIPGLWSTRARRRPNDLPARVHLTYGDATFHWTGYVDRVEGALDRQTRTVDVVVRVPRPYQRSATRGLPLQMPEQPYRPERPPLAVGHYVTVDIQSRSPAPYAVVPQRAVRVRTPGKPPVVWTVVGDTMLVERTVRVLQTVEEQTYLAPGLSEGTPIITSDIRVQTDSMRVRVSP